jgi:hypothetical protein
MWSLLTRRKCIRLTRNAKQRSGHAIRGIQSTLRVSGTVKIGRIRRIGESQTASKIAAAIVVSDRAALACRSINNVNNSQRHPGLRYNARGE